jgi:7-cyano-7-deazaguanine synthase
MKQAIVMLSGGLDSAVLGYWVKKQGYHTQFLFFDYGQDNLRGELFAARRTARSARIPIEICNISGLKQQFLGLTGENFRMISIRHNLNCWDLAVGLALASEFAIVAGFDTLFTGNIAEDLEWRPKLREYIELYSQSINLLYQGYNGKSNPLLDIQAPFISKSKTEVIKLGKSLGVDFANTWTCQVNGTTRCGVCLGCVARKKAFAAAKIKDAAA